MSSAPEPGLEWSGDVLAIVGSVRFADPDWQDKAQEAIAEAIAEHRPDVVISGGAEGMDSFAVKIAEDLYGIRTHEYLPKHRRWEPDGFKARNTLVAQECTRLLAIRCHASKTYGSGWTADEAERRGKPVRRVVL
jgi:hypothetical protein